MAEEDLHPTEQQGVATPTSFEPGDEPVYEAVKAGRIREAADMALRRLRPELYGYALAMLESEDSASDVYSRVTERFWGALSNFDWRCTLRGWAYAILRNEIERYRTEQNRRQQRNTGLSQADGVIEIERAPTDPSRKTSVQNHVAVLRASLKPEDRELLTLRFDRELGWREIAIAFLGQDASRCEIDRESARLRKRFELVKRRLAKAALECGLLPKTSQSDGKIEQRLSAAGQILPFARERPARRQ